MIIVDKNKITLTKEDKEMDERIEAAVGVAIYKTRVMKKPLALWDNEAAAAYLLYEDGHKEYVI
jgi:hypothetical protein